MTTALSIFGPMIALAVWWVGWQQMHIACVAVMMLACAVAGTAKARDLTDAEQLRIAAAILDELRDPDSVRFRWQPLAEDTPEWYCGSINAKNIFGGYVGYTPFIAALRWHGDQLAFAQIRWVGEELTTARIGSAYGTYLPAYVIDSYCAYWGYNR
jgi:hypothetical protein